MTFAQHIFLLKLGAAATYFLVDNRFCRNQLRSVTRRTTRLFVLRPTDSRPRGGPRRLRCQCHPTRCALLSQQSRAGRFNGPKPAIHQPDAVFSSREILHAALWFAGEVTRKRKVGCRTPIPELRPVYPHRPGRQHAGYVHGQRLRPQPDPRPHRGQLHARSHR